jgi:hypothetical protein
MPPKAHKSNSTGTPDSVNAEETLAALFVPDVLLPAQYMENLRRKTVLEPEKRLMRAMLQDAISCFQTYVAMPGGRRQRMFNDAEEWIMATDEEWIFSFVNVCETLGFDPVYLRQGLRRWKQQILENRIPATDWRLKRMAG